MPDLLYKNEVYQIIGASMEVHRQLGPGFLEQVYQEALELEFKQRIIPYEREKMLNIFYKGIRLTKTYTADFICFDNIIVELKALSQLTGDHESQLINQLLKSHKTSCRHTDQFRSAKSGLQETDFIATQSLH